MPLHRLATRRLRRLTVPAALAVVIVSLAVACEDGTPGCRIDTDCPPGNFCRGSICGLANPEAGIIDVQLGPIDAGSSIVCSGDGVFCSQPGDCCSQICAGGRCATSPPSAPLCRGLYEVCANDCCAGFTCRNGSCQ